ncbi:hypothetical protein [Kouleothrix sp.]|uniref:hypothetical protein n=1 Tax=Kouleothrix sp. TaxID=2779161 RepID=UPI0039192205
MTAVVVRRHWAAKRLERIRPTVRVQAAKSTRWSISAVHPSPCGSPGQNAADKTMVRELVVTIVAKRPTQQQHFCADRGYDYSDVHTFVLSGYTPHIKHRRRRGRWLRRLVTCQAKLVFRRGGGWVERTFNWLLKRRAPAHPLV